jgi:hypothetical protein
VNSWLCCKCGDFGLKYIEPSVSFTLVLYFCPVKNITTSVPNYFGPNHNLNNHVNLYLHCYWASSFASCQQAGTLNWRRPTQFMTSMTEEPVLREIDKI